MTDQDLIAAWVLMLTWAPLQNMGVSMRQALCHEVSIARLQHRHIWSSEAAVRYHISASYGFKGFFLLINQWNVISDEKGDTLTTGKRSPWSARIDYLLYESTNADNPTCDSFFINVWSTGVVDLRSCISFVNVTLLFCDDAVILQCCQTRTATARANKRV